MDDRVLINVCSTYNARLMAIQIKDYFNANPNALEVLILQREEEHFGFSALRRKPVLHDSFPAEVRAIKKAARWRLYLDWGRVDKGLPPRGKYRISHF